jgi:hypothetical protein
MFCQSPLSSGDCLWFGLETRGPSRSAIVTAVEMEHIVTTTTLQVQTPVQGLGMAVPCTLSIPGRWAGPCISEIHGTNT